MPRQKIIKGGGIGAAGAAMAAPPFSSNMGLIKHPGRTVWYGRVASFEQLINGTNSTSPCTRPRVFLLAFLETKPCPTLYPTLCFWKQLRGRGILRSLSSTTAIVACSTNNVIRACLLAWTDHLPEILKVELMHLNWWVIVKGYS